MSETFSHSLRYESLLAVLEWLNAKSSSQITPHASPVIFLQTLTSCETSSDERLQFLGTQTEVDPEHRDVSPSEILSGIFSNTLNNNVNLCSAVKTSEVRVRLHG